MIHSTASPFWRYEKNGDSLVLLLSGEWTLENLKVLWQLVDAEKKSGANMANRLDFSAVQKIDTAGAQVLYDWLGTQLDGWMSGEIVGLSNERRALMVAVMKTASALPDEHDIRPKSGLVYEILGRMGRALEEAVHKTRDLLAFIGITLECIVRTVFKPSTWRVTAVVAQLEQTGFNAVPIIVLLTFMVGAVVAFLGATILAGFGASIYTINLVTFSFLREFAVLLTAILMAGRTASAFTAQLGSMKNNEELDALRMTGLDPIVLLVLPRVFALLIALPLLTFIGMAAGILGGMMVCAVSLDISPTMFMAIFQRDIQIRHFYIGMGKAPVFAFLIAIIGCLQGFKVKGSAQSLGEHTTSAVVQSIFVVILVDAIAAMFFMEMGW